MITFANGPAVGVSLWLRRAPLFLRVVRAAAGEWDALDQLADTPRRGEAIHVYVRVGRPTLLHVDGQDGAGRRRGWTSQHGEYRAWPDQPGDAHTRQTAAWRAWCEANKAIAGQGAQQA
ncbi:MAG: hypothetical protein JWO31_939 [Phycisphaerales bacterium]|nr:hypothetical protein [Phycisphaerales bacterium]